MQQLFRHLGLHRYFSSWLILALDTVASALATLFTYLIVGRLVPVSFVTTLRYGAALIVLSAVASMLAFCLFRTFRSVIRHTTLREIWKLGAAVVAKECIVWICINLWPRLAGGIEAVQAGLLMDALLTLFALIALRLVMIALHDVIKSRLLKKHNTKRVLVYGVGDKSTALTLRLQNSPHYRIVGFLTFGPRFKNYTVADKQSERERLIRYCTDAGIQVLIAPPIDEVIDGKLMKQNVREIKIEDLLGRPEIRISLDEIGRNLRGKTILVTGAAGSIGSELCRQLTAFEPERLILFDNAETPMHNIRLELEERFKGLRFIPVIGDVRNPARLDYLFRTFRPQVVFHAAAYKHVPLMEENPCEAVLVNVAGTRNVADFCLRYGVEKMVMISTDKAVNPTNVMGASKRLAEIYVQSLGQAIAEGKAEGVTRFVTTRFGNVLGSNGSVIPRFREQIEKGGPVTVTHPDITRYFMTIPEACRLVMEAASMSTGNQIFVFDMGESVKIAALAKRMIELAGFRVGEEIEIAYTGLRPGEKLYEEVLANDENTLPTPHEKIRIAKVRQYDYAEAEQAVVRLEELARSVDVPGTVRLMKTIVPEFKSQNSDFAKFDVRPEE